MSETPPDAAGHRARLRKRLIEGGADALQDYELIEYLLALAIPRRDTKPLAKALLREFGGLGPLLSADPQALLRVPGVGETVVAALRIVDIAALRLLRTQASDQPILSGWQALLDYLQADMAHIGIERVRVLHLNTKNRLIRDETISEGSIDQSAVHVREVVKRAMELGSAAIILVHNHPERRSRPEPAGHRADPPDRRGGAAAGDIGARSRHHRREGPCELEGAGTDLASRRIPSCFLTAKMLEVSLASRRRSGRRSDRRHLAFARISAVGVGGSIRKLVISSGVTPPS